MSTTKAGNIFTIKPNIYNVSLQGVSLDIYPSVTGPNPVIKICLELNNDTAFFHLEPIVLVDLLETLKSISVNEKDQQ